MKVSVAIIGADAGAIERLSAAADRKLLPALRSVGIAKQVQFSSSPPPPTQVESEKSGATSASQPESAAAFEGTQTFDPDLPLATDIAIDPEII